MVFDHSVLRIPFLRETIESPLDSIFNVLLSLHPAIRGNTIFKFWLGDIVCSCREEEIEVNFFFCMTRVITALIAYLDIWRGSYAFFSSFLWLLRPNIYIYKSNRGFVTMPEAESERLQRSCLDSTEERERERRSKRLRNCWHEDFSFGAKVFGRRCFMQRSDSRLHEVLPTELTLWSMKISN